MSTIQQIPRSAVRLSLAAARLPLTTAEVVLGRRGGEWPPSLVFDGIEAQIEQVAGALLRDDVLVDDGRLRSAKIDRLRRAAGAEAEAEAVREDAEAAFAERRQQVEADEAEAERAEAERKQQIARDQAEATRKAEARAREEAETAKQAEQRAARAAQRKARQTRAQALGAEEQALAEEKAATARTRDAQQADAKVKATKAARKLA